MIKAKQILSAVLSTALTVGTFAANASAFSVTASAMTNTVNYSQTNFASSWTSLIQQEKQKYPETVKVNNKTYQCYWNAPSADSYSTTPCAHGSDGSCTGCNFIRPAFTIYDCTDYKVCLELDSHGCQMLYGQCAGFAAKLQTDIFQTNVIIRLYIDSNGYYKTPDGKKVKYVPQRGDSVRIDNAHSIFITDPYSSPMKFAQCNADHHCGIDWDQTKYNNMTFKPDDIYKHATYVDRPALVGDLNLDGNVNSTDATIFKNSIMKDGNQYGNAPFSAYDTDYNGKIDKSDYNRLTTMSSSAIQSTKYVNGNRGNITSIWNRVDTENGEFLVNGGIYCTSCNTTSGASFIGVLDSTTKSFTIPNTVKNPATGTTYKVTEVGYAGNRGPSCGKIQGLESVVVPTNVKKIVNYAFYNCALKTITFNSGSSLQSVGEYAFYNTPLTSISLPTTTQTIGAAAFYSCKKLSGVSVEPNAVNNCSLRQVGDRAFMDCPALVSVRIENNLSSIIKLGTTQGVFDSGSRIMLYVPNASSCCGILDLQTEDAANFRNGSLYIYAGYYSIREFNDSTYVKNLCSRSSTAIGRVYPK